MKKLFLFEMIFIINFTVFSQVQIGNDIDGIAPYDSCGLSVSLSHDGSIVAIGAHGPQIIGDMPRGAVRVYRKMQNEWTQIGNDINGLTPADGFGYSVAISNDGSIVAVGAYGYGNYNGLVQVFQNINNNWVQMGNSISGEYLGDYSGIAISLSYTGSIVAIGANRNSGPGIDNIGHVRVYQNSNDVWTKIGNDIDGETFGDNSGSSVSLSSDGSIVAIGAPFNDGNGVDSGHVRVYQNVNNNWVQTGNDINGEAAYDYSGGFISLSANGAILAIGAERNDNVIGVNAGHVRVYQNISNVWMQIGSDINGVYKASLSSNGQILATGSPNSFENGSFGTAKIYKNTSNNWVQIGTNIVGEFVGDYSASSMDLSSDGAVIAIGAPNNTGNGFYSGHIRVYNLASLLSTINFVKNNFTIVPNPVKGYFELNGDDSIRRVQIYSMLGQLIKTFEKQNHYGITDLEKGSYIIKITNLEGTSNKTLLIE